MSISKILRLQKYSCYSCVTQITEVKGKIHNGVWPSSPGNSLRHLDDISLSQKHPPQQHTYFCQHIHTSEAKRNVGSWMSELWYASVCTTLCLLVSSIVNKASILQYQGCIRHFIVVDFNVLRYENGPMTTLWTSGVIITAILAIPLFSTICTL
jgi:hypothetical protein